MPPDDATALICQAEVDAFHPPSHQIALHPPERNVIKTYAEIQSNCDDRSQSEACAGRGAYTAGRRHRAPVGTRHNLGSATTPVDSPRRT